MKYLLISISFFLFQLVDAQSINLAENYMNQGEYEKANALYKQLYQKNKRNQKYLLGLSESYLELEQLAEAEKLLQTYLGNSLRYPNINVELGQVLILQAKDEKASAEFQKALDAVSENPNYAYSVGNAFQQYNLLDLAIEAYERANSINPRVNYKIQLARLYGEQGNLEKMFTNYLYLIVDNPNYLNVVSRNFNDFITKNPKNESNQLLKKTLLKMLNEAPNVIYNQLLSWLFVQEEAYKKAFAQERAIYQRSEEQSFNRLFELAEVASTSSHFEEALLVYNYIIEKAPYSSLKLKAKDAQLSLRIQFEGASSFASIEEEYQAMITNYSPQESLFLQLNYAKFKAFQLKERKQAIQFTKKLLAGKLNAFAEAQIKMLLADIFVLEGKFNQALLYYTQIEKILKNNELAQEARFKVAKTSYYKGDFEWALTQLQVLKKSTSQQISNDAIELSRHIKDNSYQDSIQTALQKVAKADLLAFQEKNEAALSTLQEVIKTFESEPIEDEALYRMGQINEKLGNYKQAALAYQRIIDYFRADVLADNAYFRLAEIHRLYLDQPDLAMEFYEQLIFNHQDSIFYVKSQKEYRRLRGDLID